MTEPRSLAVATRVLRRVLSAPEPSPDLPAARVVELPGRGRTSVVDVAGPPGAPTLVLLHALGCTGYLAWYPSIPALARHFRVVTLDQRWHGRGIRSDRFRLDDCADDVVALADALSVERVVPVGFSMGGAVAQLTWQRHPDRVAGLVLCATARNFRGTRRERLFYPALSSALLPLSGYARSRGDRLALRLPQALAAPGGETWGLAEFRSTSGWVMAAVLDELGRFNSAPWVGEVDVPTAVVATLRDRAIPVRRQRRLAAAIPGATLHEVDAGHAALVLRASAFVPVLEDACRSVAARAAAA